MKKLTKFFNIYIVFMLVLFIVIYISSIQAKYTSNSTITDNINLSIGTYKLTLDLNGGTINHQTTYEKLFSSGEKYGNLPEPVMDGYKFQGWFTKKDGGEQIYKTDIIGQEDMTIYAHWYSKYEQLIKVRYENVDGTFEEPIVVSTLNVFPGDTFTWNLNELDNYKENSSQWERQWQTPDIKEYVATKEPQDITIDILRQLYYLDLNASFYDYKGTYLYGGGNLKFEDNVITATADIDINGKRVMSATTDYFVKLRYGSTFKFTITMMENYKFNGVNVSKEQPLSNVSVNDNVVTGIVTGERHITNTTIYDATTVALKIQKLTS